MTHSPFSAPVAQKPPQAWSRWDANKHLVYLIGQTVAKISQTSTARMCAEEAIKVLTNAVALHGDIAASGLSLGDGTSSYQANWLIAVKNVLKESVNDYDYLELIH